MRVKPIRYFLFAILLSIIVFLQGCIPAALVVGGAATGVIVYDQRKAKTIIQDRDTTFQIQARLDNDKALRNRAHVSITTYNGIALLAGQAPTEKLRNKAESIAKSSKKIKLLYNEITIGKPISNKAKVNDTWITTKVKAVLTTTAGLNSTGLKIVTENRVVYLMGLTTRSQAKLATDKVRTVAGVRKVVKLFEYINK